MADADIAKLYDVLEEGGRKSSPWPSFMGVLEKGSKHIQSCNCFFGKMMEHECDEEKNSRCERWTYIPTAEMGRRARLGSYMHARCKIPEDIVHAHLTGQYPIYQSFSQHRFTCPPQPHADAATASPLSSTLLFFFP